MASLPTPAPPPPPPLAGTLPAQSGEPVHPIPASILFSPPPSPSPSLSLSPSLLIIAALLGFVFLASVSIHLLLRFLSRPSPSLPHHHRTSSATASSSAAAAAVEMEVGISEAEEKERLIESLPLFTMASALAALPKSSPDCAICLSPFLPDAELRLLPACRHAFHAACVDAWLRTTPLCPLCRAAVSLPHPPLPNLQEPSRTLSGASNNSRSFRVEIGSISNRRSAAGEDDQLPSNRRTYSLGSFDYRVDEEVEAVVSRIARAAKEEKPPPPSSAPLPPGEEVAEAAGSRGWLREYVDRLASSASSFSGRWSARWSHSHSHSHSHRHDDSWRWDPEEPAAAAPPPPPSAEDDEAGVVALYRWIVGI